jgi:DNA-binding response OmpR family regulator
MKVILIEDDEKISRFIAKGLKEEFCNVDTVYCAEDGLYLSSIQKYDVIILDWMLPDMDGLQVIENLRANNNHTPILMLTAKGDLDDRVKGLENGADDYMTKPFAFLELVARIKALHRRNIQQMDTRYFSGDLMLDPIKREVKRGDKIIELTVKEFKLLEYLLEHKGRIITNTIILEHIWNMQDDIQSNVVNVTMYHLRKKIDRGYDLTLIETIRGAGYRIKDV